MAGGRRDPRAYAYSVEGSAARKPVWEEKRTRTKAEKTGSRPRAVTRNRASFGIGNMIAVIMMTGLMAASILLMVYAGGQLSATRRQIALAQTELTQIQEKNHSLRESLHQTMDLNELYRRATKDLGMVYPDESQIVYYSDGSDDFVRQFADIPERE